MADGDPGMHHRLHVELATELDQRTLDRIRKLLDLTPAGRLTDDEDQKFGWRRVPGPFTDLAELSLWRESAERWRIVVWGRDTLLPDPATERLRAEVLAVVRDLALPVRQVRLDPPGPIASELWMDLPTEPALRLRLRGSLTVEERDTVRRMLRMHRESGGASGRESGWRYVRRDAEGVTLLQLLDRYQEDAELILYRDGAPTDPKTLEGVRLQLGAAATRIGVPVIDAEPLAVPDRATWERLGAPATGAADLAEVWTRLDVDGAAPIEWKRGLLHAVVLSSAWREPAPLLRSQVFEYLIGVAVTDRAREPGLKDNWL
jgi:hypothetical protein